MQQMGATLRKASGSQLRMDHVHALSHGHTLVSYPDICTIGSGDSCIISLA